MAAIPVAAANCNIKRELLVIGLCLFDSDKFGTFRFVCAS